MLILLQYRNKFSQKFKFKKAPVENFFKMLTNKKNVYISNRSMKFLHFSNWKTEICVYELTNSGDFLIQSILDQLGKNMFKSQPNIS